jgi:1-deoxy-D-xylulose-5-phosphate synthase
MTATVVNCRFIKPYDRELLAELLPKHKAVITIEEGSVTNGFGAFLAREIADDPSLTLPAHFGTMGIPDRFIEHGAREDLLREIGLDAEGITARVRGLMGRGIRASRESA